MLKLKFGYNIIICISDITLPVHCIRQCFLKTLLVFSDPGLKCFLSRFFPRGKKNEGRKIKINNKKYVRKNRILKNVSWQKIKIGGK